MPEPLDWETVKTRWEAGEDVKSIAVSCRRKVREIELRAELDGWSNKRRLTLSARTGEGKAKSASIVLTERVSTPSDRVRLDFDPSEALDAQAAEAQHMADFQALRTVAMQYLGKIGSFQDHVIPKVMTSIAGALKTVQDGQRKTLRLDAKGNEDHDPEQQGVILLPVKELEASPQIGSSD